MAQALCRAVDNPSMLVVRFPRHWYDTEAFGRCRRVDHEVPVYSLTSAGSSQSAGSPPVVTTTRGSAFSVAGTDGQISSSARIGTPPPMASKRSSAPVLLVDVLIDISRSARQISPRWFDPAQMRVSPSRHRGILMCRTGQPAGWERYPGPLVAHSFDRYRGVLCALSALS